MYFHSSRSGTRRFQIRGHVRCCGWCCGGDQSLRICLRWLGGYLLACEVVSVDDIVDVWAAVGWFVVGRVLWVLLLVLDGELRC